MDLIFGNDIASESFKVFNEDRGFSTVENSKAAIGKYLKSLPKGAVVALESTGGYGKLLADMAHKAGFTVYMVQPVKIKRFRQAGPDHGKTDPIDARAIHGYVRTFRDRLHPYEPLPKFEAKLRKLHRTREGIVQKLASLRKQLRALGDDAKTVERTLKGLAKRVEKLTTEIAELLATCDDAKLLATIPSVKTATIAAVLPALRTVPFKNKYALDSFAGMDLVPNESGKLKGRRRISKEGDRYMRKALYMSAMAAIRCKVWRDYYLMLIEEKKLKKIQAINALGRKILHTIYGVHRSQLSFVAPTPKVVVAPTSEVDNKP